jgi:hypothetical protein
MRAQHPKYGFRALEPDGWGCGVDGQAG